MKVAVYDSVNKDRLLGYYHYSGALVGMRLEVPIKSGFGGWPPERITFDYNFRTHSERRRIDAATEEVTTITRTCFTTDTPLVELMELSRFALPDEDDLPRADY